MSKPYSLESYFNSIKVQLRQRTVSILALVIWKFQFHKGTIKTKVLVALGYNLSNFNSIKVQLRPHCFGIYNILVSNRVCGRKVKKSY